MATAYAYLLSTHASNITTGVREFGKFEPHRQLVSVDYDTVRHVKERRRRKCNDLKCVRKPTKSRLSLTHHANKSSR